MLWWAIFTSFVFTIGFVQTTIFGTWKGILATAAVAIFYGLFWFEDEDKYLANGINKLDEMYGSWRKGDEGT